jgi:ribosome-binding protein aMBF1 (putative translation factor)
MIVSSKPLPPGVSFQEHLAKKLAEPDFRSLYEREIAKLRLALMIAEARRRAGLSQADLACRMGTSQSTIARLESPSYSGYSLETLFRVATVLGVTLEVRFRRPRDRTKVHALPRKWAEKRRAA